MPTRLDTLTRHYNTCLEEGCSICNHYLELRVDMLEKSLADGVPLTNEDRSGI